MDHSFVFCSEFLERHRSISRSRSPRSGRYNRSIERSVTPREHSADGREGRTEGSFQSPKENSPNEKVGYKSTKRSRSSVEMSPVDENYKMSKSSPNLREIPPRDSKDLRSTGRSISPRKESPRAKKNKAKQRVSSAKDASSPEDFRNNKISISPQVTPSCRDNRGTISHQRDQSPDNEIDHQLKHRSENPGKNDGRSLHGDGISPSRSWSYSPHQ